jgi:hypothetical protein
MFALPLIPSLIRISFLSTLFKDETPQDLYKRGKIDESKKALEKIFRESQV